MRSFRRKRGILCTDRHHVLRQNITERCYRLLESLLDCEGLRIGRDNLEMVNEIIVSFLKFLLEEKCQDPESDPGIMNHRLLEMIKYVTGA